MIEILNNLSILVTFMSTLLVTPLSALSGNMHIKYTDHESFGLGLGFG